MNKMYTTMAATAALLLLVPAGLSAVGVDNGDASCEAKGNEYCAAAECAPNEASAYAYGKDGASASSGMKGLQLTSEGVAEGNSAFHKSTGDGGSTAEATGKKDWSLDEANASCDADDPCTTLAQFGFFACDQQGTQASSDPCETAQASVQYITACIIGPNPSVGCVVGRLSETTYFSGNVYGDENGNLVLYNAISGLGIPLGVASGVFDLAVTDGLLGEAQPISITGMLETPMTISALFVGAPTGTMCQTDVEYNA
jgi:hypothetical protein